MLSDQKMSPPMNSYKKVLFSSRGYIVRDALCPPIMTLCYGLWKIAFKPKVLDSKQPLTSPISYITWVKTYIPYKVSVSPRVKWKCQPSYRFAMWFKEFP